MRVGQIGSRPQPFFSVISNEGELMEKFGIRIVALNFAMVEQRFNNAKELYADEIAEYEQYFLKNYTLDELTPKYIKSMATLAATYKHLFEEFNLDVMSAECWTATPVMFDGLAPCAVYGLLNDMGYMVSCESDIHCAITMALLKCASLGEGKPLFGEFTVRHPENKNAELLWHCGPFPLSQKAESGIDSTARLVNQREWFRGKDGTYTAARVDQESGNYMMLPLICKTTDGPKTNGTYIWAEFDNLPSVENRLMQGPYIHHFIEIEGNYMNELEEFCKFVPNLNVDKTIK
jgi:L-fucose isomerase-like protein